MYTLKFLRTLTTLTIAKPVTSTVHQTPNNILASIKQCSRFRDLQSLYANMVKIGGVQDCFLMNQFITSCFVLNSVDFALQAYTQMDNPNVFVYNAVIHGLVKCHFPIKALEFYAHMLNNGVLPSSYTFSSLIKAACLVREIRVGEVVHCHVWRFGFVSQVFVQTCLVDFYADMGRVLDSKKVFDEMPDRDVFAWTTMVSCLARCGEMGSARRLFDMMPMRSEASWNTLIDGFARLGDVESSEMLFGQMVVKDIISWTTMINCYLQNKKHREALRVFDEMIQTGIIPDEVTMSTVISACAHIGALDLGKKIHYYLLQNGFVIDVYIGSALIDMYAKCGSLDRSLLAFYKLQGKNLFCWNSMIEALAVHGHAHEALRLFNKMAKDKIKPNGVTFISVLSACSHAGLVKDGRNHFESMVHDFSILPEVEHYGCMVDLLAKAGFLEEALELIRSMKHEPNAVIWGALLGGCKLYRNLEMAQIAVNELKVLEPGNSGHHSLLVNMYAEVNRWDEAAKTRVTMKELGVEKACPGSSWIEMEDRVHQFAASDKSHPSFAQIDTMLFELDGQLRLLSYVHELI